ncbi:MoaD/ThiS family protein [Pedobacter rhodius]|uniref:MoaD/ThiS family protein n=1 Tax=Pedobacter rhodius TaxID=3004098 RepID=A0ABT4L3W3_9SPHI|nr:MoaD/ThiS family protein [Pedobacter sp. SJ11]MCZ4225107.1 MoaD/ThiS family protein [Pedobacter sp. SJ11]
MQIELISFGKLSDFIPNQNLEIEGIENTDDLKQYLEKIFPELAAMKYKLALNKNLVQQNSKIKNRDSIALMPPFSGG